MSRSASVLLVGVGLICPAGLPLAAQTLDGSAERSAVEVRLGGDLAAGRDIVVASAVAGVRSWDGRAGPWIRLGHVTLGVVCFEGACESEAWSVAAGFDAVVADWGWGGAAIAGGVGATFWEQEGTRWSPIATFVLETRWESRVRPFLQARWEQVPIVNPALLVGGGVSLALRGR